MRDIFAKFLLFFTAMFWVTIVAMAESSDVSNVTAYQEGKSIIIEYDLAKTSDITPYVSVNGGSYVKLTNVNGDVGPSIVAGHKRMVWDVLNQYERFEFTDVKFKMDVGGATVTDICGNVYPVVKIGEQYWMAENMRCNKYDTKSEAWKTDRYFIPTSNNNDSPIYFIDASDRNNWSKKDSFDSNLIKDHIKMFGYLYNWAAAVGVMYGQYYKKSFKGRRQGICPNGWHVPQNEEWQTLFDYIASSHNFSYNQIGTFLKTEFGWYLNGNGIDMYGFAIMPTGYSTGKLVFYVGSNAYFWSSTPNKNHCNFANSRYVKYSQENLGNYDAYKGNAQSVRCVKD